MDNHLQVQITPRNAKSMNGSTLSLLRQKKLIERHRAMDAYFLALQAHKQEMTQASNIYMGILRLHRARAGMNEQELERTDALIREFARELVGAKQKIQALNMNLVPLKRQVAKHTQELRNLGIPAI